MPVPQVLMHPQGPQVSQIVYGTWRLADGSEDLATPVSILARIEACLEVGITTFDLADIYGGYTYEKLFGDALRLKPELRSKIQLISKTGILIPSKVWDKPVTVHHYDTSYQHVEKMVYRSLQALGTDYLDVMLIHRPDYLMDADELAKVMTDLRISGKVKYWGVSNHTVHQFELLQSRLEFPLVTNQIEFSVLNMDPMDDGSLDLCQKLRIKPMAWSPLGGGRLLDEKSTEAQIVRIREAGAKVAAQHKNISLDLVAFAWILRHPTSPIIILGTNNIERIRSAASLFDQQVKLDRQEYFLLWEASKGREVP